MRTITTAVAMALHNSPYRVLECREVVHPAFNMHPERRHAVVAGHILLRVGWKLCHFQDIYLERKQDDSKSLHVTNNKGRGHAHNFILQQKIPRVH